MKLSTKLNIVLAVLVILLASGLAIALVNYGSRQEAAERELQDLLTELQEQKTINKGLVRAAANQVSPSDLKQIVNGSLHGIKDDLNRLDARVIAVSQATGRLEASMSKPSGSDAVATVDGVPELTKDIPWTSPDGSQSLPVAHAKVKPAGTSPKALQGRLTAILGPAQGAQATNIVLDYLSDPDTSQWETGTYPLDFHVTAATAVVGDGGAQTQYVQIWASRPGSDQRVPLAVVESQYQYTDPTTPEFRLWSPHIDAGIVGVVTPAGFTGGGGVGFSVASYGLTDDDNSYRFIRLSVGTDGDTGWVGLDPAGVNLGKHLPVVDDVWLYGGVVVSPAGYGGSISVTSTW